MSKVSPRPTHKALLIRPPRRTPRAPTVEGLQHPALAERNPNPPRTLSPEAAAQAARRHAAVALEDGPRLLGPCGLGSFCSSRGVGFKVRGLRGLRGKGWKLSNRGGGLGPQKP